MRFSFSKIRLSFQVKVLAPVITAMVLLSAVTIWLVNQRISAHMEREAANQLAKDHLSFANSESGRINNLLATYRSISGDTRYRQLIETPQTPEELAVWYRTSNKFLTEQLQAQGGVAVLTCALSKDATSDFAKSAADSSLDVHQFQARSALTISNAFEGEPATDIICVGTRLLAVISIPVTSNRHVDGMADPVGVITFGVDMGEAAAKEVRLLKGNEILILAEGQVISSSLTNREAFNDLVTEFAELSRFGARSNRAPTHRIVLGSEHYICEAGRFDSRDPYARLGYLMLSSYEESWAVLKATQQMLLAVGLLGIVLSTAVVCILIGKITAPLRQLRDTVEAVGRGDFSRRVEVQSRDECGELAVAFNEMTENIKTSRGELEKTVETLKATQNQLIQSEKLSGIGEFVAGVAHELNNPLTSVMGFSELLQQGDMPEQQRRYLDVIFKSAKRCQKIVQSLLSFARRHAPERKVVCVNEIVESAVEILQYQMRTSNIEVQTLLEPRLPATEIDPHQMQQVFLNIINNARQAMEGHQSKGCLRVSTETVEGVVRVIFKDNGPGIPPENLKRIFNPFFTTKEVGKGTGLGLSLCYGIVSEHGGTITPQSKPGDGATFVIELPISREAPRAVEKSAASGSSVATREGVGKRVLVIDDEDLILQMIREVLSRNGYRVDIAHDGESALRRLSQYHYDLALCDWKMPGLNGQQVFERLHAENPDMSRRMIFITGDVVNEKVQEFLRERDKVCLSKPFTLVEFRSAISRVISPN